MTARFVLAGALLALAAPAWAVNKDIERLQIQIAALQGQIADLQRTAEDNQREIKRLADTLTEQNAFLRKALQDRRTQDDALQTAIKEFGERMAELEERLQQPAPAAARTTGNPLRLGSLVFTALTIAPCMRSATRCVKSTLTCSKPAASSPASYSPWESAPAMQPT